ncbi:hypothetical protein RvY_05542-2 [Ramazzottius varieornatus]|uniref:Prokineticin domain-containing protein n=1 Tax=Ramazzottius varieornatus TaxID=947166 RepID=A0A1D1V101_RAMVA|nr:hypothetical protein RvY_05542-2 [Ramazzottius varieornatus]
MAGGHGRKRCAGRMSLPLVLLLNTFMACLCHLEVKLCTRYVVIFQLTEMNHCPGGNICSGAGMCCEKRLGRLSQEIIWWEVCTPG